MRLFVLFAVFAAVVYLDSEVYGEKHPDKYIVKYGKLETFLSGMHSDIYHLELDLYKNDGSILFSDYRMMKSTDGNTTETIVGSTSYGYQEGIGSAARFKTITGFTQISKTNVAIVDYPSHCLRMLDRKTQTTSRLAGVCTTYGNVNGKSGRFYSPWGVVLDSRDPNKLFVTDYSNNALRSILINTGEISTVISGLSNPRGLRWNFDKTSLFITNEHYIREVKFDGKGSVTKNVNLAGSTSSGNVDGTPSQARFYTPFDIAPLLKGVEVIADYSNARLRTIDTNFNQTHTIWLSGASSSLVKRACSVLPVSDDLYIAYSHIIYKLSGFECWIENSTVYAPESGGKAEVKINPKDSVELPVGEYLFKTLYGDKMCGYFVNVKEPGVMRTLSYQSTYDVACDSVVDKTTRSIMMTFLQYRAGQFLKICGTDCKMSQNLKPFFTCKKDILTVTWPTDRVYADDVTSPPEPLVKTLTKKLNESNLSDAELFIINHNPPLVLPKDGVHVVITSTCKNPKKTYQKSSDSCV